MSAESTTADAYKVLATEVKEFIEKHESFLDKTGYYKGTQILFSPAVHKPKFMFIGINPGPGYYNRTGNKVEKFPEQKVFEYADDDESYKLMNETKKLFELAGCIAELPYSVKTNYCFVATNNENELEKLFRAMLHEHRIHLNELSVSWIRRLIKMIEPKIIICEGKSAYNRIHWTVFDHRKNGPWEGGVGYFQTENGTHVVGYARTISTINDVHAVAAKIRELNNLVIS